jgi:ATP-dependent Lhr-like helicase
VIDQFHPVIRKWFSDTLGQPTQAQLEGWTSIRDGRHTLIAAPTGSGKTLAAFLSALNDLFEEGLRGPLPDEVRVIYVSPLKALSADIHKNLAEPRKEIRRIAEEMGLEAPRITAAVRTGDTPSSERAAMLKTPPHILVTTPESLYLLLTAERSREMLRTVRTVIVDEIHAVIGTRRGAHLALSLERLQQVAARPLHRVGLSATQRPIELVSRYLSANDECAIIDHGHRREMDLAIEMPRSPLEAVMSAEVWTEYYDRLTDLINAHRTTLVFVNTRKMAERVARQLSDRIGETAVTAHHGSLSKESRLDAEMRLKNGDLKALVATASLELGIDIGHVDLVCQIGSPHRIATFLQRVGRSGHTISGTPKGRIFPASRDDLVECAAMLRAIRNGELDRIVVHDAPLDVLAQQIVAEAACDDYSENDLFALVKRAWPYRDLSRENFDAVVKMLAEGYATRRGRRGALVHRDEVNGVVKGRRGSRMNAISSGGAIPEVADYRVVMEPDDTFIGTLNEDFAIESNVGDIFQLGNASWQVLQVASGTVRVADAKGAPPTIPFWLGEAPARSDELSKAVSDYRKEWRTAALGCPEAEKEIATYFAESEQILGTLPTQDTLILERFFDESGGMQLVLHAPFGSRINRAWGLALRKRFCRQFNFELQAAATEDGVLLSLGPQHSFPLADVFRYLHPNTVKDILVQAFLVAPVFATRWRWNTTISLAIPRNRNGKKIPPQLQRSMADDLMAAVFPDGQACPENLPGDRELPDHPLVNQAVRDCLEEAMDFEGLSRVLSRIHSGEITLIARDTPEPSPLCHELINAKPYAFLDDAPLEERRTQAVYTRRAGADSFGVLDAAAIERVRDEAKPDPRDADELHDALLTAGFLLDGEFPRELMEPLVAARRAGRAGDIWITAERLPELLAVRDVETSLVAPASRARAWTREEALVELIRGRLTVIGPTTAQSLASSIGVEEPDIDLALLKLESEGVVLRGTFETRDAQEWCDRALLARIHRYTLNRLRAEIEPVTVADFTRFLFDWQHVTSKLRGVDGVRTVVTQLEGIASPVFEKSLLPSRIDAYDESQLDAICLTGEIGWAKFGSGVVVYPRTNAAAWCGEAQPAVSDRAQAILDKLRANGASFIDDREGLEELVEAGLITSDGFYGRRSPGRWSLLGAEESSNAAEVHAMALLRRYGVVFRRLAVRENVAPWRDIARIYRRMEARGDLRGGRFVHGMSGEQFALPEAVERLREMRREGTNGRLVVISAADPLNLTGVLTSAERVRAIPANRIAYRDGIAVSVMEGDYLRPLIDAEDFEAATALAGRRVPVTAGYVGRTA